MQLNQNVGREDKNVRMGAGIILLIIGLFFGGGFLISLIGLVLFVTGVLSFCWFNALLDKNTATAAELASTNENLTARAFSNLIDFKEKAVKTACEIKEKSGEKFAKFKSSERGKETKEKIEAFKEKASDVIGDIKSGEFTKDAKEKLSELKEDASDLVDSAKEKIAKAKNTDKK